MPYVMRMIFDFYKVSTLFEICNDLLSRHVSIQAVINACQLVHRTVVVHHADYG